MGNLIIKRIPVKLDKKLYSNKLCKRMKLRFIPHDQAKQFPAYPITYQTIRRTIFYRKSRNIYWFKCGGLGDKWLIFNHLFRLSVNRNEIIRLAVTDEQLASVTEIIDLIDSTGCIKIVDMKNTPDVRIKAARLARQHNHTKYFPTKITWKPGKKYKRICYQFDGASRARRKNPPKTDLTKLLSWAKGYEFVQLGKHLSLGECVSYMAQSDMFMGVDSGMSHIAHSVGVPTFIVRYGIPVYWIKQWHNSVDYTLCDNSDDLIEKAKEFLQI